MGKKDDISDSYMSDNEHFADAFNYYIYGGERVIKAENLVAADTAETAVIDKLEKIITTKKTRDVIKHLSIKREGKITYAILGVENQSLINYAMPVRNLIYDALSYGAQVYEEEKALKQSKKKLDSAEYLSGFGKDSRIYPVITLVINWGNKKWDGPRKLSDMLADTDPRIKRLINDYEIRLLDPHDIDDFDKFSTMLGDVLEFIKCQDDEGYLERVIKEKGEDWAFDKESVNVINTFTDAQMQISVDEEGKVKMCRAVEVYIERGMEKGENKLLIEQICKKLAKGKSVEVIADEVEKSTDRVQEICNVIGEISPDYDVDKIYEAMSK